MERLGGGFGTPRSTSGPSTRLSGSCTSTRSAASASGRAGEDRHLDRLIGGASRHLPFDEARSPPEGEAERPEGAGHVLPEEYAADLELLAGAAEGRGDAVRTLLDEA